MKIYLLFVLIIAFSFSAIGQSSPAQQSDKNTRVISTDQRLLQKVKNFKTRYYSASYDKSRDRTTVMFIARDLLSGDLSALFGAPEISFAAGFEFSGQTLDSNVENYYIYIYASSNIWKKKLEYLEGRKMSITADDRVYVLNDGEIEEESVKDLFKRKMSIKWIKFSVKGDDLQTISTVSKIKFNLGEEYDINDKQQKVLKDILIAGKIS